MASTYALDAPLTRNPVIAVTVLGGRCYDHHNAAVLCTALGTGEARSPRVSHPRGIGKSRLGHTTKLDSCSQAIVHVDIAIEYIRGFSSFVDVSWFQFS
jgi:hypothetical protein